MYHTLTYIARCFSLPEYFPGCTRLRGRTPRHTHMRPFGALRPPTRACGPHWACLTGREAPIRTLFSRSARTSRGMRDQNRNTAARPARGRTSRRGFRTSARASPASAPLRRACCLGFGSRLTEMRTRLGDCRGQAWGGRLGMPPRGAASALYLGTEHMAVSIGSSASGSDGERFNPHMEIDENKIKNKKWWGESARWLI